MSLIPCFFGSFIGSGILAGELGTDCSCSSIDIDCNFVGKSDTACCFINTLVVIVGPLVVDNDDDEEDKIDETEDELDKIEAFPAPKTSLFELSFPTLLSRAISFSSFVTFSRFPAARPILFAFISLHNHQPSIPI